MKRLLKKWLREDDAVAAIEAGFLFPVMLSIMIGVVDLGMGLNVNQKVVNATAMLADLLTREEDISDSEFSQAVAAAQLAIQPYATSSMGYDVAGIQFIGVNKTPTVQWRDTFNMEANGSVTTGAAGLGDQNEGLVAVTVRYVYSPLFTNFVVGDVEMEEVFYMHGRKSSFVTRS